MPKTYTIIYKKNTINVDEMKAYLNSFGLVEDKIHPEFIFSFGGDGTFIDAKNVAIKHDSTIVGINYGNLGHYNEFGKEDLPYALRYLDASFTKEYKMLDINGHLAINELSIINPTYSIFADIYVNGKLLEKFQGSGLVVSTPTGSTGLNKSIGGAMMMANLNAFQLTPIAPIDNNFFNSIKEGIVIDGRDNLMIKLVPQEGTVVNIDGEVFNLGESIEIRMSNKSLKVLKNNSDDAFLITKSFVRSNI